MRPDVELSLAQGSIAELGAHFRGRRLSGEEDQWREAWRTLHWWRPSWQARTYAIRGPRSPSKPCQAACIALTLQVCASAFRASRSRIALSMPTFCRCSKTDAGATQIDRFYCLPITDRQAMRWPKGRDRLPSGAERRASRTAAIHRQGPDAVPWRSVQRSIGTQTFRHQVDKQPDFGGGIAAFAVDNMHGNGLQLILTENYL